MSSYMSNVIQTAKNVLPRLLGLQSCFGLMFFSRLQKQEMCLKSLHKKFTSKLYAEQTVTQSREICCLWQQCLVNWMRNGPLPSFSRWRTVNRTPCRRIWPSSSPHSEAAHLATLEFERCNESAEMFSILVDFW